MARSRTHTQGGPAGENIASASPGGFGDAAFDMATWAVHQWYIEYANCASLPGCSASNGNGQTGHFTALVWKGTTHMGCVVSHNREVAACRYGPGPDGEATGDTLPNCNVGSYYENNVLAGNVSGRAFEAGCPTPSPTSAPTPSPTPAPTPTPTPSPTAAPSPAPTFSPTVWAGLRSVGLISVYNCIGHNYHRRRHLEGAGVPYAARHQLPMQRCRVFGHQPGRLLQRLERAHRDLVLHRPGQLRRRAAGGRRLLVGAAV